MLVGLAQCPTAARSWLGNQKRGQAGGFSVLEDGREGGMSCMYRVSDLRFSLGHCTSRLAPVGTRAPGCAYPPAPKRRLVQVGKRSVQPLHTQCRCYSNGCDWRIPKLRVEQGTWYVRQEV